MYTYLIVDDEELIRRGTIKKLSPLSDQVTCIGQAENGLDAIQIVEEQTPDFVILDMQMPEMDGMSLLPYLSEHYPSMPLVVISGYRNFDYIKQAISSNAIEYILKPFSREEIQNCVKQVIDHLHKSIQIENRIQNSEKEKEAACYEYDIQLLNNLLLGSHITNTTLTSQKLNFINDTHNLMLLTLHFSHSFQNWEIQNWLDEHGFGDLALFISDIGSGNLGSIILFLPQHSTIPNEQLASQILDALQPWAKEQGMPFIAGISKTHEDLCELNIAFQETSQALNQQLIATMSPERYFYKANEQTQPLEWTDTEEFLFRIEAGMIEEVKKLTDSLFAYYATIPNCTLADAKYHCYQLSDQCRQILDEYINTQKPPVASASMQNVVNHIFTIEELKDYYMQFFINLSVMIRPQSVYAIEDVIEKIQIYMQRNLQKDLTQDFIASLFFMNRSYLSTLFKSRTNKKFVDYLNEIRIERSKELLLQSNRKMYQIARSVGYDNVKYFFRVFKKFTKMTPEQYRTQKMETHE